MKMINIMGSFAALCFICSGSLFAVNTAGPLKDKKQRFIRPHSSYLAYKIAIVVLCSNNNWVDI